MVSRILWISTQANVHSSEGTTVPSGMSEQRTWSSAAPAPAMWRSHGSTTPPPDRGRFPHARPGSAPSEIVAAPADECRHARPRYSALSCGDGQRGTRSGARTRPTASDPTSAPSGCPCSRSSSCASSATLLLPMQLSVCCIDHMNPRPKADICRLLKVG